ncbi:MAG TPA: BTAD domain-containing putative transcriptional regulator, partial [Planctomycetota bacterium]|nr:BTAD domain-containing putative transcriptional regulator [Planctomycetota bacterium]
NVIMATINQPHTSLRELRTDVSDVTIALIDRCLAKDPAARFADGAELVAALQVCRTSFATPGLSAEQIKQRFSNLGAQPSTAVASPVPPLITESTIVAGGAARSASAATAAATAIAPAPKKSSGALALVGAALLAIIGIGGLFGFYAWRNADFETQRTALLEKAGSGLRASGPALSEAIESLAAFRRRNGWASEEQFQPVVDLQKKLSEREGVLAKRRSDFESMVSNARQLITADPEQAIEKLNAARDFGKENATDTLPDLNAALVPSIDETIKVAKGLIERRIAEEAARERQRRRDDFRRLLGAAQSQADTGKWREAIDKAQEALKTLGEQPDEQIETANALLRTGKEELNRRAVYAEHVAEGQKALDEGRHDEAIVAFRKARETWKEAPDKTVEEGIAKAEAKLSERRFEAALGVAQEELGRGHYAEAQKALEVAGKERPNGKEIQELAKKIEQKQGEEKFMREMQEGEAQLKEGEYELAQKAFERACELRPNEKKPKQKAAEASARGLLKQGDVARDKGDKAAAEQLWNQALAAHPEMRDEVGERFSALRKDALAAELREIQALIKAQKFQDAQARAVNAQQTLGESKDLRDLAVALESLQRAKALGKKLQSSVDAAIAEAAGAVKVDDGDKKSAQIKSDLDTFSGDLGKRTGEIDLAFAEGKYAEMRNAVAELEKSSKTLQQQLLDAATYFDERAAKNVPKDGPSVGVGGFGGRRGVIGGLGANIPIGGGNAKKAARYNDIANNLKAIARDLP